MTLKPNACAQFKLSQLHMRLRGLCSAVHHLCFETETAKGLSRMQKEVEDRSDLSRHCNETTRASDILRILHTLSSLPID
jgi:hypothetical protein